MFLVLEATIGFNKRDEASDDEQSADPDGVLQPEGSGKIKLTTQDQKFLRALKILIDEDSK